MRRTLGASACIVLIATLAALVAAAAQGGGTDRGGGQSAAAQRAAGRNIEHRNAQVGFGVEVLAGGRARETYPARGRAYVEAVEGEEYALRLTNPLPMRVAVALSVDGLNTIDARRTSAREASKWVIQPYGSITVSGWQMSSTRARRFYFTGERDSYANRIGRASDMGVITAVFFRERRDRSDIYVPSRPRGSQSSGADRNESKRSPQSDTPAATSAQSGSASGRVMPAPDADDEYAATGIGRSVTNDVWSVQMDLETSPAAVITLRYEFHDALVRLGILPRNYRPQPDPLRRRERARGFEDRQFSPEP